MIMHAELTDNEIRIGIRTGAIVYGGNNKLNIYGSLKCRSGKRLKRANRVFFSSKKEAEASGYRPCGNCMRNEYVMWKNGSF